MMTAKRFVLLLAMGSAALGVHAQPAAPEAHEGARWEALAGEQLFQVLSSPAADARTRGLTLAYRYARFEPAVDLAPVVPALVAIYRSDASEQARIAAVAVLQALGDEGGMQQLYAGLRAQTAPRVRHVALAALLAHYGPAAFEDAPELIAVARTLREGSAIRA